MWNRKIILLFLLIIELAFCRTFKIGEKELIIPAPSGYAFVTEQMEAIYNLSKQTVSKGNDRLGIYIQESEVPAALSGQLPEMEKYFTIEISKKLKNITAKVLDFSTLKNEMRSQNWELSNTLKNEISRLEKSASKYISDEYYIKYATMISSIVPLEPHWETDNAFSYSLYVKNNESFEEIEIERIVAGTMTLLNVSGRVLFLYCYGTESDLDWTRKTSKQWAESILESNINNVRDNPTGSIPSLPSMKIIILVIAGAVIVFLFAKKNNKIKNK